MKSEFLLLKTMIKIFTFHIFDLIFKKLYNRFPGQRSWNFSLRNVKDFKFKLDTPRDYSSIDHVVDSWESSCLRLVKKFMAESRRAGNEKWTALTFEIAWTDGPAGSKNLLTFLTLELSPQIQLSSAVAASEAKLFSLVRTKKNENNRLRLSPFTSSIHVCIARVLNGSEFRSWIRLANPIASREEREIEIETRSWKRRTKVIRSRPAERRYRPASPSWAAWRSFGIGKTCLRLTAHDWCSRQWENSRVYSSSSSFAPGPGDRNVPVHTHHLPALTDGTGTVRVHLVGATTRVKSRAMKRATSRTS